jgi:hypothetical protein
MYRAKYTTTGTYADNTNVRIDLIRRIDGLPSWCCDDYHRASSA